MKIGDRVKIVAPDNPLLKYMGQTEATGEIVRFRNGKVRVLVDGSESQDTEGYRCYQDFDRSELTVLEEK